MLPFEHKGSSKNLFKNKVVQSPVEQEKKYSSLIVALQEFNQNVSQHPQLQAHFFSLGDGLLVAQKKV